MSVLGLLGWALLAACKGGDDSSVMEPSEPAPEVSVTLDDNPYNTFSVLATVTSEEDGWVSFEHGGADEVPHETPRWDLTAGEPLTVQILGLKAGQSHSVVPSVGSDRGSWTLDSHQVVTDPLPDDWPRCEVVHDADPEGIGDDEVVCTNGDVGDETVYHCVDRRGETVWGIFHPQGEGVHAFRVLQDGSFAVASDTRSMLATASETGEPLAYWTPGWFDGLTRFSHHWIDNHEVIQLTEGRWAGAVAIITQTFEEPEGQDLIKAPGIVVMDPASGEPYWDWSAAGHDLTDGRSIDEDLPMERTGLYAENDQWVHANALLHRVEGDTEVFWMSMRHQDWIARIDVDSDDLTWRLGNEGDFELAEGGEWFFQSHAPEWIEHDGDRTRFLLFDNGVVRPTEEGASYQPYSRVVEYTVDTSIMQVEQGFTYGSDDPHSEDWFYSSGTGDVDLISDGTRLHFVKGYDENEPPFVAELSYPDGELLWKLSCTDQTELYRVNGAPSLYELDWRFE